jgi:hypothetical protein
VGVVPAEPVLFSTNVPPVCPLDQVIQGKGALSAQYQQTSWYEGICRGIEQALIIRHVLDHVFHENDIELWPEPKYRKLVAANKRAAVSHFLLPSIIGRSSECRVERVHSYNLASAVLSRMHDEHSGSAAVIEKSFPGEVPKQLGYERVLDAAVSLALLLEIGIERPVDIL